MTAKLLASAKCHNGTFGPSVTEGTENLFSSFGKKQSLNRNISQFSTNMTLIQDQVGLKGKVSKMKMWNMGQKSRSQSFSGASSNSAKNSSGLTLHPLHALTN